ncbi:MAG TPA: phospholipase C, phosphocholine-specific [Pilimelia sp.]|nr:phospholipase C, phosphocholine-specific [Pilimelia sp.]
MTLSHGTTRRRLLAGGAGIVGGAAAGSLLPPSVHAALAAAPRQGGLRAIKHVVFLMQENRSFDHYFGALRGVRGFGDRNAITLPDGRSVFEQPAGAGAVLPFSVREAASGANKDLQFIDDLPHGWPDGQLARADGWHNGWIPAKTPATMTYYERRDLPFHYELADTFTICDAYHCSVFSSTSPNRNYHVSGYTGYEPGSAARAVTNAGYAEDTHAGYAWPTYAELLERHGVSWRVYQEYDNYQDNNLELFVTFKQVMRKALRGDFLSLDSFYSALARATPAAQEQLLARLAAGVAALTPAERSLYQRCLHRERPGTLGASFRRDVEAGALPAVSWIVPSAADSEHPSASSPAQSATITYQILDALAANPETWQSTALFITYDENDGFFDHVPPPVPPADRTDEFYEGKPIGLGIRVPMLVVSPWSVGGYVCSQVFDHSSTVRLLETWLGIRTPVISAWRRTVAGDLTSAFDFTGRRRRPRVGAPAPVPPFTGRWRPVPPTDQRLPQQEPGVRPARPLPYQPDANARIDPAARRLALALTNDGTASVHFALYPYHDTAVSPRHLDVARREVAHVPLPATSYHLVVTGPNGFRREFAGDLDGAAARAEVSTVIDPRRRTLRLLLRNGGDTRLTFDVVALAYGEGRRSVTVRPGGSRVLSWPTRAAAGWYDLRITTASDKAFGRRLMGHIENRHESVSG